MKRLLMLCCVGMMMLLIFPNPSFAQRFQDKGYKLGIGGVIGMATPYYYPRLAPGVSVTPNGAFSFGPKVHYGMGNNKCSNMALRGAINLSYIRYTIKTDNAQFSELKSPVRVASLEIPLLFSISSKIDDVLSVREYVGLSLNVTDDLTMFEVLSEENGENFYQYKYGVEVPEASRLKMVGGIGLEWKTKSRGFFSMALMYNGGFKAITKSNIQYTINDLQYSYTVASRGSYFGLEIQYFFKKVPLLCPEFTGGKR